MPYLALIGTATLVHLLALISPGPDFIMAVRNSLVYSKKTGLWTAVGFGLGISVHIFYCLAGLAVVISKSILIFNTIKLLGAGYLIYIGLKSLYAKSSKLDVGKYKPKADISTFAAIKTGFLTNVLNPKATLFFLSLFTFVISPTTPFAIMLIIGGIMILNTILWFSLVAVLLSHKRVRAVFERFQNIFNKTFGGLLLVLGIKIALTEK